MSATESIKQITRLLRRFGAALRTLMPDVFSHIKVSVCLLVSAPFIFSSSLTVVCFKWLRNQAEARRMSPALLLMKMNFLLDIPLTSVKMHLIRSTCAATAIIFWRKPCKRSVGIDTAQPACRGLYGRSLLQRVTLLWPILWLQVPCAVPLCSVGESLWLPGPQVWRHCTVWKYLPPGNTGWSLPPSLFPVWMSMGWERLDYWAWKVSVFLCVIAT